MITGGKPALMRIKFINSLNIEFVNHNIAVNFNEHALVWKEYVKSSTPASPTIAIHEWMDEDQLIVSKRCMSNWVKVVCSVQPVDKFPH